MLYKVTPFGYFGRPVKISRGPWFQHNSVEDDGLECYYVYTSEGKTMTLLSNNMPWQDRERMAYFYQAIQRNNALAWFGGLWLGVETVLRVPKLRGLALGWRALALFGVSAIYKGAFDAYNAQYYGPVIGAFVRKYNNF